MYLKRRKFLTLAGLASVSALLSACGGLPGLGAAIPPLSGWPEGSDALFPALNRLTFGPIPAERARAGQLGLDGWLEEQLAPQTLDDSVADGRIRRFDTLKLDASVLFDVKEENVRRELQQATLLRAVYSQRQLYEIMVDFWSDHFNIYTLKAGCAWQKTLDDRDTIRPHVLGQFRDLLWASMHSPAMLVYLDNQDNHKDGPNENYARELMELHTLGLGSGYTQQDVQEVARCLTGLTVSRPPYLGSFRFDPDQHDFSSKLVLGQTIPGGSSEVDRLVDIILAQPSLPEFISTKLVRRFVADDPPANLVKAAAATFTSTSGDIKAVLTTILHSPEMKNPPAKLKRPFNFAVGALRQLGSDTNAEQGLLDRLGRMGQPLFQWPTPDGYSDDSRNWRGNLTSRWQFGLELVTGQLPGTTVDLAGLQKVAGISEGSTMTVALDRLGSLLLGQPLPAPASAALVEMWGNELDETGMRLALAVLLASPHYQWR